MPPVPGSREWIFVPTERHLEAELSRPDAPARGRLFRDFVAAAAARLAPELAPVTPHTTRLLTREALAQLPQARLRVPDEPAARDAPAHADPRAVGRLRRAGTTPAHLRAAGTTPALLLADILAHVDDRARRRAPPRRARRGGRRRGPAGGLRRGPPRALRAA